MWPTWSVIKPLVGYARWVAKDFLLVIADREPLAWILTDERMAFSRGNSALAEDDRLFLYATRGCFRNPGRDRGRVIGEAVVTSSVRLLPMPVVFGGRKFPFGCNLQISGLAARDAGPELRDMVGRLHRLPDPRTWSAQLRRALVPLDAHDAAIVHASLAPLMRAPAVHRDGYLDWVSSQPQAAEQPGNSAS
jgi:hypothetical protein